VKCDLHVHSWHSGPCDTPSLNRLCRESYTHPERLYRTLRRRGVNLATITDHDSIEGAARPGHRRDVFLSEEVTCHVPRGTTIHVGLLAVPIATLLNYARELAFSRRWASRVFLVHKKRRRPFRIVAPSLLGEEA
jgi:predicted metal-dependent phosphoesterase TrpH